MPDTRTLLASIVSVAVLLAGCGPGAVPPSAVSPGGGTAADPRLPATASPRPVPASATEVARQLAARWATAPRRTPAAAIVTRVIDYDATVFDPQAPDGFTAFIRTKRTIQVSSASAAEIAISGAGAPWFPTPADQALWVTAGRPRLELAPATGQTQIIPAGEYTFLSKGSTLTYQQAASLPDSPVGLAAVIRAHLRAYGPNPPAGLLLEQTAFLIATAPLTNAARSAAWQVIGSLPGLRLCQPRPVQPGPVQLCLAAAAEQTLVSVDFRTGSIRGIADRLLRPSPVYPHVAAGMIVGSSTFTSLRERARDASLDG